MMFLVVVSFWQSIEKLSRVVSVLVSYHIAYIYFSVMGALLLAVIHCFLFPDSVSTPSDSN